MPVHADVLGAVSACGIAYEPLKVERGNDFWSGDIVDVLNRSCRKERAQICLILDSFVKIIEEGTSQRAQCWLLG